MDTLSVYLALNGAAALLFCMLAGLTLYFVIRKDGSTSDLHLLHAAGTARGTMLLALAATIHLASVPSAHAWWISHLFVGFVWASILAMTLRAVSGEAC